MRVMTNALTHLNRFYIETNRYTIAVSVSDSRLTPSQLLTWYCRNNLSNLAVVSHFNGAVPIDSKMRSTCNLYNIVVYTKSCQPLFFS